MTAQAGRSVPEWKGKTPDTAVPPRVRRRVFDAYGGRCYLSGLGINPGDIWHLEHIRSLRDGGLNIESNLAPALVEHHKEKTKRERKLGAKADRIRNKHINGRKAKTRPMIGSRASDWKHKLNGKRGRDAWERRP